ncbi:MAG: phage protein Gp36 family protein [Polyangia bacterium]
MPRFCQQSDVERVLGGASAFVQLLARDGANVADPGLVDQILDTASAEMASYLEPTVTVDLLEQPYPYALISKTADLAAFHAWRYGAYGQAIPDVVVQGQQAAIKWGQDVRTKNATLGAARRVALNQPTGVRDPDPLGRGISIQAFKRGFR